MKEKFTVKVDGGIGRNICATAMIRNLKKKFPKSKINVVCSSPDVWKYNPNIEKAYPLNNAFLWDDVIKGTEYLTPEPYNKYEYYHKKEHLAKVFCNEAKVECDTIKPDLFFSEQEIKEANKFLTQQKKEIVLFQPFGRTGNNDELYRNLDPLFAQKLVNKLVQEGYGVIQVSDKNQPKLQGCIPLNVPLRPLMALIANCKAVIGVDSFLQHAARSFDKKTIVFWGGTNEKNLGYPENVNIRAIKLKEHYPIRIEHNTPSGFHKNIGSNNKFNDKHIKKVLRTIKKW